MAAPVARMNVNQINGGGAQIYPSNLTSLQYFCSFHFVEYNRLASSGPTYIPQGNIYLPLPLQLQEEFAISYDQRALGIFGNALSEWRKTGGSIGDFISNRFQNTDFSKLSQFDTQAFKDAGANLSKLLGGFLQVATPQWLGDTQAGSAIQQSLGIVQNPHMTTIFEGVELRKHSFSWVFAPSTEQESETLEHVINTFRRNAHPAYDQTFRRFALTFPYEVFVNFVGTNYLYPVKRAVINSIVVDNAASGKVAFYQGGAPTFIGLTVNLTETEILTRADFDGNTRYTTDGSYEGPDTTGSTGGGVAPH